MNKRDIRRVDVFAQLQMAAEALIGERALLANGQNIKDVGTKTLIAALVVGNEHASKFTPEAAQKFASEWTVVKQQASTRTGFSAA